MKCHLFFTHILFPTVFGICAVFSAFSDFSQAQTAAESDRFAPYRQMYAENETQIPPASNRVSESAESPSASSTLNTPSVPNAPSISSTAKSSKHPKSPNSPSPSNSAMNFFPGAGNTSFGPRTAPELDVSAKVTKTPSGNEAGEIVIFAAIPEGFKIYSVTQSAGGPFPTKIHLSQEIAPLAVPEPKPAPKAEKDEDVWGDIVIETHKHTVEWRVAFRWTDEKNVPTQITGSVEAQMCDANSCLPPKKFPFTAPVPAVETSAAREVPESSTEAAPQIPVQDFPSTDSSNGAGNPTVNPAEIPAGNGTKEGTFSNSDVVPEISAENGLKTASGPESVSDDSADVSPADVPPAAVPPAAPKESFAILLLMAYLGGLILNLMPCVLPVIAPKLHSFMRQSGEARSRIFLLNVSYTFGLLTVLWFLAALSRIADLTAFLRSSLPESLAQRIPDLQNMGWGQQFTYPAFVIFMIALVFIMGLSFLGVWEIPIPGMISGGKLGKMQRKEGFLGAYCMGILTTLLATPCVGPYLGTVFGWVVTQSVATSFLVFTVIGLGLGTPYLLIGAFPVLIRFLPKPGEWMETFKEIMGFFFMGTVVWLFYVLSPEYVVPTLGLLTALWFACWLIGKTTLSGASREATFVAWAAGIIFAALVGFFLFSLDLAPISVQNVSESSSESESEELSHEIPWKVFSAENVEKAQNENRVVFIDFTARWCATCQTNSKFAIQTTKVNEFIRKEGIEPLLADWTQPSEEIEHYIRSMGHSSIPLIVIWIPGKEQPILLDGLITESKLLSTLEFAVHSASAKTQY